MILKIKVLASFLLLSVLMNIHAFCQSVSRPVSSDKFRETIDQVFGFDQRLVSGEFYIRPPAGTIIGHPYYIDGEWKIGSVIINGKKFDNLLLKYDIEENKLVLNTSNLNSVNLEICLRIKNITRFTLGDRVFIKSTEQDNTDEILFYELISDGEVKLLQLKRKKLMITTSGSIYYEYQESIYHYIMYNDTMEKFHGIRTVNKLFPQHKKALRKYAREHNLIFNKDNINDRIRLLRYCNLLLSNTE